MGRIVSAGQRASVRSSSLTCGIICGCVQRTASDCGDVAGPSPQTCGQTARRRSETSARRGAGGVIQTVARYRLRGVSCVRAEQGRRFLRGALGCSFLAGGGCGRTARLVHRARALTTVGARLGRTQVGGGLFPPAHRCGRLRSRGWRCPGAGCWPRACRAGGRRDGAHPR